MAIRVESEYEILPGYRLLEKLGSGGYGEVWKAEAPGGLLKAVKIIHADIGSDDPNVIQRSEQELKALRRVQSVRHPYLLSIERYDIVDGRLVIVTELADCNLWDRFTEYRQLRQAGIPRDDLLRYMMEAAEVLDLMNMQHQLQHLDIKPQNLFLVHDHIKVADFGLVRDFDTLTKAEMTGGVTPIYAAPETFEGLITGYCDQYSLAIVYQELLTGKRPFTATSLQQLIAQHLQSAPDLSALPPTDRGAIAQALAKKPEDRHPTCRTFVRALMAGGAATTPPPTANLTAASVGAATVLPSPDVVLSPPPWTSETPATQILMRNNDDQPMLGGMPLRKAPPEVTGDGVLFPALVIAIGEVGLRVIQKAKSMLIERFGGMNRIPNIRFLYIDTDPETIQSATDESKAGVFTAEEILPARLNRAAHYLKPRRNGKSILEGWFDSQVLYRIKAGNPLTQGLRCLGRLAFCDHYRTLEQKLKTDLEALTQPESLDNAEAQTQLTLRTNQPRVYVVAGLGGGTGSGMFIDVAYAARHQLRQLGYTQPDFVGLFLLPPHSGPGSRSVATGNTFAALTELNHYSMPGITYTACIDDKEMTLLEQAQPFGRFSLLPLRSPRGADGYADGIGVMADFLWRDLLTPFGRGADMGREQLYAMPGVRPDSMTIAGQTFGLYSLSWPRQILAEESARLLCLRIIESWNISDGKHLRSSVDAWVREQWQAQNLSQDYLSAAIRQTCDQEVGKPVQEYLAELVEPLAPKGRWSRGSYDGAAAFQALSTIVQLLGPADDIGTHRPSGRIELALASVAEVLTKEWSARVGRLAMYLIDQPEFRLAGAEEATTRMQELIDKIIAGVEPTMRDQMQRSEAAYLKAQQVIEQDTRRKLGAEVAQNLQQFAQARYQYLLGRHLVMVYTSIREQLTDSLREIDLIRKRLSNLLARLQVARAPERPTGSLLPPGCRTIADAVAELQKTLDDEAVRDLEAQFQAMIEQQFKALAHVCITSTDVLSSFESAIMGIARRFMLHRLGNIDVAEMYLARYGQSDKGPKYVVRAYTESEPALEAPDAPRDTSEILAVPVGPQCQQFLELVAESLPHANPTITSSPDDIVFYREQVTVPLKCLPHIGSVGREAYEQMILQQFPPHTRIDIRQWYELG